MTSFIIEHADNPKAIFVFSHGAGADMYSSFMVEMSQLLVSRGISVMRFNFPYMDKRAEDGIKRPPNKMPILVEALDNHLQQLDTRLPICLGGKSMGSRVCATWLTQVDKQCAESIIGVVAIGYPFHPIGKPDKLRLAPLQENECPVLIIQGERDKLGNKAEIATYELPHSCRVLYMLDGDHDLKPRIKSGFTHQQHIKRSSELIEQFIDERI